MEGIYTHMIDRLFAKPLTERTSVALDLSAMNSELLPSIYGNGSAFNAYIEAKIGDKIGFGGYLEHRVIYETYANFATTSADFRNIHLGVDFWTKTGTTVFAPLDGVVHSFQVNHGAGNYGPTIVLHHPKANIYSLYGHLSMSDLSQLEVGMLISAGQKLCHLGDPTENGGWPPHLHFQLIRDMQGFNGDYPGVCSKRDVDFYAHNCPDPASFGLV